MSEIWMVYALIGAILWGIDYAIAEKVLQRISVTTFVTIHLFFGFITAAVLAYFSRSFQSDVNLLASNKGTLAWFIAGLVAFVAASIIIPFAIQNKNATVIGLIEISYPLFIILFSWLLFRTYHLSWHLALGGVLVIAGISIIYYFQK